MNTVDEHAASSSIADDRYRTSEKYTTLVGVTNAAEKQLSPMLWNYLWCGTGDENTRVRNTAMFDEYQYEAPLFAGITNPRTNTKFLDIELSFPLFTAPFGQEAVFHPEGHRAVGRAAEKVGVSQMVPVAASHTLEDVASSSSCASIYQMTFVGEESDVLDMIDRAKAAGYRYICATYSPIRQWRERLREDRFVARGVPDHANFGPGLSNPAAIKELIDFTEPRWTWEQAANVIKKSSLPVIVKGVHSVKDAKRSLDAGAAGLYVSNYGGRTLDRTASTIEVLPEIRKAVGPDIPIVLDSGVRRGSDIATAVALGANAVAIGRLTALGLAADGEYGVQRVLEILKEEFWTTLGHLGCSTVDELSSDIFRQQ
ncbi:alpha-hydroxy acid oxidase [Spelaeicoccus albus]|uniref:4-hydroxymandelate oxidase n=1 Tax=Spelaeicoccus albus TaxID=1280376 RepID=A0A7Z0ABZ2_9MICO|nr:alpha-hydroxy acid oxidase [Spelaeicoccus albus]NYI67055.1 4-hydroxymandelate oxidase [Spelaeicoccus albus]